MKNNWKKRLSAIWKGWGYSFVVTILIATSFKSAIADWNDVPTGSMKPTILEGDRVFVNKLAYDLKVPYTMFRLASWANPNRGDIVVFYSPEDGKRLVKRVVGLPGDTITMRHNRLFINGEFVQYEPLPQEIIDQVATAQQSRHLFFIENLPGRKHAVMITQSPSSLNTFGTISIPEGQFFMMGDNRDNSADSRVFGFVDRQRIVGRATMVVISREESFLKPRWNRFFKELS